MFAIIDKKERYEIAKGFKTWTATWKWLHRTFTNNPMEYYRIVFRSRLMQMQQTTQTKRRYKIKNHAQAIENWNEFCKNDTLELCPHPNSGQYQLENEARIATEYFDNLPEIENCLVDEINNLKYRYNYDGEYEHYELIS